MKSFGTERWKTHSAWVWCSSWDLIMSRRKVGGNHICSPPPSFESLNTYFNTWIKYYSVFIILAVLCWAVSFEYSTDGVTSQSIKVSPRILLLLRHWKRVQYHFSQLVGKGKRKFTPPITVSFPNDLILLKGWSPPKFSPAGDNVIRSNENHIGKIFLPPNSLSATHRPTLLLCSAPARGPKSEVCFQMAEQQRWSTTYQNSPYRSTAGVEKTDIQAASPSSEKEGVKEKAENKQAVKSRDKKWISVTSAAPV